MKTALTAICYNLLFIAPAELLLALFGPIFKKIRIGLAVRKEWDRSLRKSLALVPKGDRVLFHASSAGELQQALPVIRRLKAANPALQFGISFYSVSGMSFFKGDPSVAFTTYMPFDSPGNSTLFMQLVRPKLYVVASWDMWFNHCLAARNVGAEVIMIAAVLAPDSSRLKFPLRGITRETFRLFTRIYTVSEGDAERISHLIGGSVPTEPAGDPRYDHILEGTAKAPEKLAAVPIPRWDSVQIMTLGSIWEPDWEVIGTPLLEQVSAGNLKLLAAPHQMHEPFLAQIESDCLKHSVTAVRFSQLESYENPESVQVIIVDTVGLLAALYSKSRFAYIGGAFGRGVHNTAEPAAFALPLWFGPKFQHSLEARRSVENGSGVSVQSEIEFRRDFPAVLNDPKLYESRSAGSRSVVHDFAGSADRISAILLAVSAQGQ